MPPSQSAAPAIQIWLMDGWRVLQSGKTCDIPTGQPRALLTYLLLQPGHSALRSTLVEELWPDANDERGRRYLSDALYRLRRCLDPAPILADAERIALDMSYDWWVDVWAFYAAAASHDPNQRLVSLDLFAPTLALEISDHWILVQRLRLQERFVQVALELAERAELRQEHAQANAIYRLVLEVDPLLESAHRGLMRALAHTGQLAAAVEQYDLLVDRLERELAAPPSNETRRLADQLFQELELARRRAETRTVARLVGRVGERSRLLSALDQARAGQAGMVVLLGEAGIGKSALLRDLANAAGWRGWQIHWGVSEENLAAAPFAPLTSALHNALPEPRAAQLATTLPGIYFDLLARLFPQLVRPNALPSAAFEPKRLPQALAQLCHALQEIAPLLLLLDNLQWGDPALWQLLHELAPLLHQQRTLLVLSAQPEPLRANAATWTQLESWDREGLAQIIALEGLAPNDLGELASLHAAGRSDGTPASPFSSQQRQALYTASAGNPLLALEIMAAGTPDALLESRPAIATLVTHRLRALSPAGRQAAALAAILGAQVRYAPWEALWRAENPYGGELAAAAAELERAQVLQINRDGYSFAHDTLHSAALADMEEGERRRRHSAALAVLQSEPIHLHNTLALLYHAQGCQDRPATINYALQAGRQALAALAFAQAESHFTLALAHIDSNTGEQSPEAPLENQSRRYVAFMGRIEARHVMAQREGELADLDAISALPLTPAQQVAVLTQRAGYHVAVSEMEAAELAASKALALGVQLDPAQEAGIHLILARSARDRSLLEVAHQQLTAALHIYQVHGDAWGMATSTDLLGGLAWDQGNYELSAALHQQAADAFQVLGDQIHEAQSLNNLGSAYWELGRYADARAIHERSILVCRELGNKLGEGDNIDNLGGVAWSMGDYTLAIRQYRAALELRESINDLWGVGISLSNLASAYRLQGNYEQALEYSQRALPLYEQVGRKRGKAYVIEGEGLTLLAMGRVDEAWARLQIALELRQEIGDRTHLIEIHAALAHAALARQEVHEAAHHSDLILSMIATTDRATLRQIAYFALFAVADRRATGNPNESETPEHTRAARFLALALNASEEMAAALPASDRARFLRNVPLNRETMQAAQRYQHVETVLLGMGNQAQAVAWMLSQAEDYLLDDESERRRHVLARLLAQAGAQNVTPTHDQLAAALGVSRRTILRDLAALPTRHTLPSVSPPLR